MGSRMGTAASLRKVGSPSSGHQEWDILLIFSQIHSPTPAQTGNYCAHIVTWRRSSHGLGLGLWVSLALKDNEIMMSRSLPCHIASQGIPGPQVTTAIAALHRGGSRAPWEESHSWTGLHRGWCHQRLGATLGVEGRDSAACETQSPAHCYQTCSRRQGPYELNL